jgi:DNA-binding MarR family transcriptional regulator
MSFLSLGGESPSVMGMSHHQSELASTLTATIRTMSTRAVEDRRAPPGLGDWVGFVFFKAGWAFQQCLEEALEHLGLRGRHFAVMTMLAADSSLSQQEMSTAMSLDPTTMVDLVDDLERWGLVARRRNPEDRRRYVVGLTRKGRLMYEQAGAKVDVAEDLFFAPVKAAERKALGDVSRRLMEPHWGRPPH